MDVVGIMRGQVRVMVVGVVAFIMVDFSLNGGPGYEF
jgi:hypothetical protein